jgi:hypothetical protein
MCLQAAPELVVSDRIALAPAAGTQFAEGAATARYKSVPRFLLDLSDEIRRYCIAHPSALDTLDGIAWWVAIQHYEEVRAQMSAAVDRLVDDGVLIRYRTQDGATMFACSVKDDDFDA